MAGKTRRGPEEFVTVHAATAVGQKGLLHEGTEVENEEVGVRNVGQK